MSVLIRGMEMPTTCSQCPLYKDDQYEYCSFGVRKIPKSIGFKPIRPDWCPLVEIPPHGRLIDADVPVKCYYYDDNVEATVCCYETLANFLGEDCPPTVIDAEDSE